MTLKQGVRFLLVLNLLVTINTPLSAFGRKRSRHVGTSDKIQKKSRRVRRLRRRAEVDHQNKQPTQKIDHLQDNESANATIKHSSASTEKVASDQKIKTGKRVANIFKDAIRIHRNILEWNTFQIATAVFPFFVGTRMIDEKLQRCFYDEKNHENKNQLPQWAETAAKWSISIPIIFLGMHAFFAKDEDFRETSRVFLIGLPFVIWVKDIIKKLRFESALRPWHKNFSNEERASGGFPSGHMAEAAYTATLYGMRFGPKAAIPLSIVAGFVGVTFLTGNRHYVSQLVAGAGFGIIYAVAANKVIDANLPSDFKMGLSLQEGAPALALSYRF